MQQIHSLLKNITNKKLLVMFPHPDDESVMAAGLIQQALRASWQVRVICLTHGEAGKIHINCNGLSLKEIRKKEFEKAMRVLGVSNFEVKNFADGKLASTKQAWQQAVKKEIEIFEPGLVVTYDTTGITGHPDHVVLSHEISLVVNELRKDKSKNATQLLWPAYDGLPKKRMYHPELIESALAPTHHVSLAPAQVYKKYQAIKAHQSQQVGKSQPIPLGLVMVLFGGSEYYTLAPSVKPTKPKFIEFVI
jgi:LmbE family N-acetylglucosaminyl deacetylase